MPRGTLEKMGVHDETYVISPSQVLKLRLEKYDSALAETLRLSAMWIIEGVGDRSPWSEVDREIQIKLLFLALLKTYYVDSLDFADIVGELFITVEAFDTHWTIAKVYDGELVSEAEEELSPEVVNDIQDTGNPLVDEWIAQLKTRPTA